MSIRLKVINIPTTRVAAHKPIRIHTTDILHTWITIFTLIRIPVLIRSHVTLALMIGVPVIITLINMTDIKITIQELLTAMNQKIINSTYESTFFYSFFDMIS